LSTLPAGLTAAAYMDSRLTPVPRGLVSEPVKRYTLAELTAETGKQLPGVDRNALERHLVDEDFERVLRMPRDEFYRQPAWKRNDAKTRAGLTC